MSGIRARSSIYAGFWQRFIAHIIDWMLTSIIVAAVFVGLVNTVPSFGRFVEIRVPFQLFELEKTVDRKVTEKAASNGESLRVTVTVFEVQSPLVPTYTYRTTVAERFGSYGSLRSSATATEMIDPATMKHLRMMSAGVFILPLLLILAALFEASRFQASPGKMVFGLTVASDRHRRLTFGRALIRNFSKFFSMITLFIGFMMIGWTNQKQGLHDLIAGTVVRKSQE